MGISIKWDTTYQCTSMCKCCINANHLEPNECYVSSKEAFRVIKLIHSKIPIDFICFLGDNPLHRPEFITLLEHLEKTKIHYTFHTTASPLRPELIQRLSSFKNLAYITTPSADPLLPKVIRFQASHCQPANPTSFTCPKTYAVY